VLGEFEVGFETGAHRRASLFFSAKFWVVRTGYSERLLS
jgi:hypothetical protein